MSNPHKCLIESLYSQALDQADRLAKLNKRMEKLKVSYDESMTLIQKASFTLRAARLSLKKSRIDLSEIIKEVEDE